MGFEDDTVMVYNTGKRLSEARKLEDLTEDANVFLKAKVNAKLS